MKRYRVWQANREVFLWPENWLYPELRDNPSPFFQQMMSSLLQGDITDDAAASAYLDYLTSLEEVAKLEPCGLYYQPGDRRHRRDRPTSSRAPPARTASTTSASSQSASWTPWAQVQIECEDMPITPIVWNGRLFLFWLKASSKAAAAAQHHRPMPAATSSPTDRERPAVATRSRQRQAQSTVTVQAMLCWTEYYNGTGSPPRPPTSTGPPPSAPSTPPGRAPSRPTATWSGSSPPSSPAPTRHRRRPAPSSPCPATR